MSAVDPGVMRIARTVARERMNAGAVAVVLTGSHARGDAAAHSDIDLIVVAARQPDGWNGYSRRAGYLVSADYRTPSRVRAAFRDPSKAANYVPGWRDADVLVDPSGVAARLQAQAIRWTWERIEGAADAWVAAEITGWAEEVHKLVNAIESSSNLLAATQRSLLALHLANAMAVERRILFGTENVMWDLVAQAMGEPWSSVQARSLSMSGESLQDSGGAALELYALAAREVWPLLDRRQRAIVGHACTIAGQPLPADS